jgi:tetratricopeptide (TPR) repeat protein
MTLVIEVGPDEPIGDLIRRARRARFQSQQQLAQQLNHLSGRDTITGHEVGRWESHERIPRPHSRQWIAEALGIDQLVLDRAAAAAAGLRRSRSVQLVPGTRRPGDDDCPAGAVAGDGAPTAAIKAPQEVPAIWDELITQRALTAGEGLPGLAMPDAVGRAAPRLSSDVLLAYARLTADYRRLDNLAGPATIFYQAREHHQQLMSMLSQARGTGLLRQVAGLVADSGDLLAWLLFDLGEYPQAFACYRQAAKVARQLDDVSLHAYLVGRAARTLSECGRHGAALNVAAAAERIAASSAHPAVRSWLAVTRAFDYASLDEEADCRRELETGARLLEQAKDADDLAPGYIAFYGPGHLLKWTGHAILALARRRPGQARQGARAIDEALGQWPSAAVRESAELLTASAAARLLAREIEQAAALTSQAHAIARDTASRRNLTTVNRIRRQLRSFQDGSDERVHSVHGA